jgi:hypothetical protein
MGWGLDEELEWYEEWDDEDYDNDFENNIWTTKDKQKFPLRQMTTSHIKNAIRHIQNSANGDDCCYSYGGKWLPKLQAELRRRLDGGLC